MTLLNWLDQGWTPTAEEKKDRADGPEVTVVTELINAMLSGRKVKSLEKPKSLLTGRAVSGRHAGLVTQNFDGPVCRAIITASDTLMAVPFSPEKCARSAATEANRVRCKAIWDTFKTFLAMCAKPLDYSGSSTVEAVREARAQELEPLGKAFVEALKIVHPNSRSWYVHWAGAHCGDDVRVHGDFAKYAMDGLEAKHSVNKQLQFRLSNSIQGQRVKTVMSHHVLRESVVQQAKVILILTRVYLTSAVCLQGDDDLQQVVELKEKQARKADATRSRGYYSEAGGCSARHAGDGAQGVQVTF